MHFRFESALLHKQWNPEQITGYLKRIGVRCFSHETIYRYIWRDKKKGGLLWKHLRCAQKRRRKRFKVYDSRGRIANKRNIADRPAEIETRETLGHWEIDTVMGKGSIPVAFQAATLLAVFAHQDHLLLVGSRGFAYLLPSSNLKCFGSKHCVVTLVQRKTGYTLIGQLNDRTTKSTNRRTIKLMSKIPEQFKTITSDKGTEFHQYKKVQEVTIALITLPTHITHENVVRMKIPMV